MLGATVRQRINTRRIEDAQSKATYNNIRHALFSISKLAKGLIGTRRNPSPPGEPPHTRAKGGRNIRGAIFTAAEKDSGIVGPRESWIGTAGEAHEFGGEFRGAEYPERPFMSKALEANIHRFHSDWKGTIGE